MFGKQKKYQKILLLYHLWTKNGTENVDGSSLGYFLDLASQEHGKPNWEFSE